jgi:chorismate--pyruvate lyase
MTPKAAPSIQSVHWFPAERLGQMNVEPTLRTWLIAKGMLSARVKTACGDQFALRLIDQWTGLLTSSHKLGLRSHDTAGLFRDIEMVDGGQVWIFGQTVMPDSTLSLHPWLAELGDTPLDETLLGLSGVDRGSYEYARLPAHDALTARARSMAEVKPEGLWARRSRVALRGAPLLMQEVFLPGIGRSQTGS